MTGNRKESNDQPQYTITGFLLVTTISALNNASTERNQNNICVIFISLKLLVKLLL